MLSFKIAVRFLRSNITQTVLISIGMAIGLAVIIFVGSLISSLQVYLIEQTLGSTPQIVITAKKEGAPVTLTTKLKDRIGKDDRITGYLASRNIPAILKNGDSGVPVVVISGEENKINDIYDLSKRIVKGKYVLSNNEVLIGKEVAEDKKLTIGDEVSFTLSNGSITKKKVTGIFDLGLKEANERSVFASLDFPTGADVFKKGQYSSIGIQVQDVLKSDKTAAYLRKKVGGIKVSDWQVEKRNIKSGLESQSSSSFMIQFFVIVAVSLSIASTLSISAMQKTKQIGILKAIGMTDGRSGRIFLWQGMIIGTFGTGGGVLGGYLLIRLFSSLASGADNQLFPINNNPGIIVITAVAGVLVSLLSSFFPFRRTSKLDPIEVIQGG